MAIVKEIYGKVKKWKKEKKMKNQIQKTELFDKVVDNYHDSKTV